MPRSSLTSLVHLCQTHEEIEVEPWAYKWWAQISTQDAAFNICQVPFCPPHYIPALSLRCVLLTEPWLSLNRRMLRFLIGKAGSELRHIQNNYKAGANVASREISKSRDRVSLQPKHLPGEGEHSS